MFNKALPIQPIVLTATVNQGARAQLPDLGLSIDRERTAVVITDPQNDFLSPDGVTWGVVGKSVEANGTVANIGRLFAAAKGGGLPVFVSPHYYYPHDYVGSEHDTSTSTIGGCPRPADRQRSADLRYRVGVVPTSRLKAFANAKSES